MLAYLGPQGTFTEQAARGLAKPDDDLTPYDTVPAALDAVRRGDVDAACVPVENSVEGAVPATMDALASGDPLVAVGEIVLPVRFSILVRPGSTGSVKTVTSHPHALAQVRSWLAKNLPEAQVVPSSSTAAGARAVLAGEFDAAVSAPVAVHHYPLEELATGVNDVEDAKTRFLLVERPGTLPAPTGSDRTSVVVTAADRIGALSELLAELALRRINLTRIESRPTKGRLGEYRFYIDLDGHVAEPAVGDALAALHRHCPETRFLGSYPRAEAGVGKTDDSGFEAAAQWLTKIRTGNGA
ncbi:prephenate dehydratase [Saccharothrix violaceirubra]|uniref:Prephenate dehydratase n=1 Tax=Saccharothrix violaceirubra TaxID=413306 RepID=A0A7W7T9S0_9PSEU|nr:prephenate dehydratase [Saccharothrix violaceirubra]MBB4969159.1 prephenate dehydratase [Saccharothrix violaceirubra]